MSEPLVVPLPSHPAYDAFVTHLADIGLAPARPFDVEMFVPMPDGSPGQLLQVSDPDGPPPPELGDRLGELARHVADSGVDRILVMVRGVPLPEWAEALFGRLVDAVGPVRISVDLLGVEGYRWMSWHLGRGDRSVA
jgi:hypothetical protein